MSPRLLRPETIPKPAKQSGSKTKRGKRQATPRMLSDQKRALKKIMQCTAFKRRYLSPEPVNALGKCIGSDAIIHFSRIREIKLKQLKSAGMDNILEGLKTELQNEDIMHQAKLLRQ
jgi:hypothetical protein